MATNSEIYTLHKYYIWANSMRVHYDKFFQREKPDMKNKEVFFEVIQYMSFWYSALFVVVEGWRDLGLEDERINELLDSHLVDLLRRFRNGVFHYQRNYFDNRFWNFIEEKEESASWVRVLNREFGRYFLTWAKEQNNE